MQKNYKVQGSKEASSPIIVNHDNVYIHDNIRKLKDQDNDDLYEYDEIIMTKDEYIEWSKDYLDNLESAIGELGIMIASA